MIVFLLKPDKLMADLQLKALVRKIDDLILLCDQLDNENRQLKSQAIDWAVEREQLIEKSAMARSKVVAMITKLKALEQEQ